MQLKKINDEVLFNYDDLIDLNHKLIDLLKKKAKRNKRKRIRICIHKNEHKLIQEMFIIHMKDAYVRPHKHIKKSESLYILEGKADILFFNESGEINKILRMGDYASGKDFYYKIEKPTYHCLIVRSEYLVFHEVTQGPFRKEETIFAPWSPDGTNTEEVSKYTTELTNKTKNII
jgi:cupin fold WbuC family metalloprotein